ncbi:MAG: hypothetical protein HY817_02170 [Candidatus Abawacabacteria bacterium]|nr:hypothetical protein [Candidatus Abawacabacteria bacterium]
MRSVYRDEIDKLVDTRDLIDNIAYWFRPVQRQVKAAVPALWRDIQTEYPQFPNLKKRHFQISRDVRWHIHHVLEHEWGLTEVPPPVAEQDPAFVIDTAVFLARTELSTIRRQGLRLITRKAHRNLLDQLHSANTFLWDHLPLDQKKEHRETTFSSFHRFWQKEILAKQGLAGVSVAYLFWKKYFESIFSPELCHKLDQFLLENDADISDPVMDVIGGILVAEERAEVESQLITLGKFMYRGDLDEEQLQDQLQPHLADTTERDVWALLKGFGPAELAEKLSQTSYLSSPAKTLDDVVMLATILNLSHLDSKRLAAVLGSTMDCRSLVMRILGETTAAKRLAHNPDAFTAALMGAQEKGYLPEKKTANVVLFVPPNRVISAIQRQYSRT